MFLKAFRFIKVASAVLKLVNDPNKLDEVFKISDGTSERETLAELRDEFSRHPRGAKALSERRRLGKVDLEGLGRLPEGTLGREFADHMKRYDLKPEAIPTLDGTDELEYIRAHLYETHDIWHVVTGFQTDVAGELGLQAFYLAQFHGPLPSVVLAVGLLNTAFKARKESDSRMDAIAAGWIMGKKSEPLFGISWDDYWETPIEDVRRALNVRALTEKPTGLTLERLAAPQAAASA